MGLQIAKQSMGIRVKICGITNLVDALSSTRFGADALGLRIRPKLSEDTAKLIVQALPPFIAPVLLVRETNLKEIVRLSNYIGISTIQIYSSLNDSQISVLRNSITGLKIIRALAIIGPETVEMALKLQYGVDALLLDTVDLRSGQIGGTGKVHDWTLSREIVSSGVFDK